MILSGTSPGVPRSIDLSISACLLSIGVMSMSLSRPLLSCGLCSVSLRNLAGISFSVFERLACSVNVGIELDQNATVS